MDIFNKSNKLSEQDIFDYVIAHLINQKTKSLLMEGGRTYSVVCAYRGGDNTSCAVGCLLSDDEYISDMEGKTADTINLPERLIPHEIFLTKLQNFHDCVSWPNKRKDNPNLAFSIDGVNKAEDIAAGWCLELPESIKHMRALYLIRKKSNVCADS